MSQDDDAFDERRRWVGPNTLEPLRDPSESRFARTVRLNRQRRQRMRATRTPAQRRILAGTKVAFVGLAVLAYVGNALTKHSGGATTQPTGVASEPTGSLAFLGSFPGGPLVHAAGAVIPGMPESFGGIYGRKLDSAKLENGLAVEFEKNGLIVFDDPASPRHKAIVVTVEPDVAKQVIDHVKAEAKLNKTVSVQEMNTVPSGDTKVIFSDGSTVAISAQSTVKSEFAARPSQYDNAGLIRFQVAAERFESRELGVRDEWLQSHGYDPTNPVSERAFPASIVTADELMKCIVEPEVAPPGHPNVSQLECIKNIEATHKGFNGTYASLNLNRDFGLGLG